VVADTLYKMTASRSWTRYSSRKSDFRATNISSKLTPLIQRISEHL